MHFQRFLTDGSHTEPPSTSSAEPDNSVAFQTTDAVLADTDVRSPNVQEMASLAAGYALLTIFLLILVVISFFRFHHARVTQNRQRLEAMADQLEKDKQTAAVLAARRSGHMSVADEESGILHPDVSRPMIMTSSVATTSTSCVPAYLDLFHSFSERSQVRF